MRRWRSALGLWALLGLMGLGTSAMAGTLTPPDATTQTLDKLEAAAREQLQAQAEHEGLNEPLFEASVSGKHAVPNCGHAVTIEGVYTRYPSRMRFAAVCSGSKDAPGWRQEFVVRATVSARVVVLLGDVPAGRALGSHDLELERRALPTLSDLLPDPKLAVGQASKRALRGGDVLRRSWLVGPQLVERGGAVRIVARNGPIEVTVAGEALEAGGQNDIVRVRNSATGKVFRARVRSDATVEPEDIPGSTPVQ